MNSCELVTAVSAVACAIAKDLSNEEINLISSVFMQLGDSLAVISANRSLETAKQKQKC
ncbi:MAG: hypothetical protein FWG90_11425 [Oscillospiraceae bacterium]|nr:hypothetical protein [Oscillospiraceae bacterium]